MVLVGMMGCGKSAVGEALALRWGVPFWDTDAMVVGRGGWGSVAEGVALEGMAAFRRREGRALVEALAAVREAGGGVVATGGGVVLSADNRAALRGGGVGVVYLQASVAVLAARVRASSDVRPLLGEDAEVEGRLAELLAVRDGLYAEVADVCVRQEAGEGVVEVVARVGGGVCGP